eukprot:14386067-Alexandrium_andersonii.AAC.1
MAESPGRACHQLPGRQAGAIQPQAYPAARPSHRAYPRRPWAALPGGARTRPRLRGRSPAT